MSRGTAAGAGVSIAEVARGVEVNPNVLHRWGREFRKAPGTYSAAIGKQRCSEGRIAELLRRNGERVNHKRVQRVYRAAGLCVRRIQRKRLALAGRAARRRLDRPCDAQLLRTCHAYSTESRMGDRLRQ